MKTTIVITHNRFPEIAAKLPRQAGAVVRKTTLDVEAHAKTRVPVDTGALKNSIQSRLSQDSLEGIVKAGGTNDVGGYVEYAVYVEYGTRNPNYPAQPYMTPAAEVNAPKFKAAMEDLLKRL